MAIKKIKKKHGSEINVYRWLSVQQAIWPQADGF